MKRFRFIAVLLFAMQVVSCVAPEPVGTSKSFVVQQKSVSATGATVAWEDEYSVGGEETYKVTIYEGNDTKTPYQTYAVDMKENTPRAFTFSYLKSDRNYSVVITNQTGKISNTLSITTSRGRIASASDIVLNDFDNLNWGYDYINGACGVKLSLTTAYMPETIDDTMSKWKPSTSVVDDIKLNSCSSKVLSLIGFEGWDYENVYIRPGYVRMGSSSSNAKLVTSVAKLLPDSGVEAIVELKACQFSTSETSIVKSITINHVDSKGNKVKSEILDIEAFGETPAWSDVETSFANVHNGDKFEFETSAGSAMCIDDIRIYYKSGIADDEVFGYLVDNYGNPVANVAVSDGFSVVRTNSSGLFHFKPSPDAYYIFYTVPAEFEIQVDEIGRPCFFQRYNATKKQYDFLLKRLPNGREREFFLFGFADPQVSRTTHVERFSKQVAPEVKSYSASLGKPCYGITLGDVISMGSTDISKTILPPMRSAMHADKMGMPVFQVMGNHDNCYMTSKKPVEGKDLRDINLNIQRMFEEAFGPINYSFERGGAHIIGMRNIQWKSGDNCATDNTRTIFTKDQYDWLLQDLKDVPREKVVVLCIHIPIYNKCKKGDGTYRQEVLSLLDEFTEAHILSGHTHYQHNYDHKADGSPHKIYEHVQAAVNGASWTSNINGDGVPNGYGVYHFSDNTIKDWYYKGYAEGMNDRNYQIRLYRGNAITGAEIAQNDTNSNKTKGYYQFGYDEDDLLANVFNSDTKWNVEVYEDGVYSGPMKSLATYHWDVTYDQLIGSYVYNDPKRPPVGANCGRDFWAVGVLLGKLGCNTGSLYYKHCYQLWRYKLKNKNAKIEVRAKDRKGNVYTCSTITEGTDMTNALYNN